MRPGARLGGAAALAVVLGATGCFWPAPGAGPDRTGHNPYETQISPETVAELEETWTAWTDGEGDGDRGEVRSPVTSDQAVHASAGVTVYGFDTETGDRLWDRAHDDPGWGTWFMGPATFAGDVLWSGSLPRNISGQFVTELLDPATGEVVGAPGSSGLVDGVRGEGYLLTSPVFVASGIGPLLLFVDVRDSEDPDAGWRGQIAILTSTSSTWRPLTLGDDLVYQAGQGLSLDEDGNVVQRNGIRGYSTKERPDNCPPIDNIPATVICPTWFTELDGASATAVVLDPAGATAFVGSDGGTVHAVDAATGEISWSTPVEAAVGAEPALAGGNLFVPAADGRLVVLDAGNGDIVWEASAGDELGVQPAVAGGVVFTGAADGTVNAFDAAGCGAEACDPLWSASTGSAITGAPAVSEGQLYVGTSDGRLIAYVVPAPEKRTPLRHSGAGPQQQ